MKQPINNKFNIVEVNKLNEKYNYKIKSFDNTTIYIETKTDNWYAETINGKVFLYHKNTKFDLNNYHFQRKYNKLHHMFDSIDNHKFGYKYINKFKKMDRIDYLLKCACQ